MIHSLPCEVIKGNHELSFLGFIEQKESVGSGLKRKNYDRILEQMGQKRDLYLAWMKTWPLFIDDPLFLAVHAGVVPGLLPEQHEAQVMTRIRTWGGDKEDLHNPQDPPWFELYEGEKLVVYGHWAAMGLTLREKTIGLDSGCVWGGALSALVLPSRQVIQVKAKKTYCDPHLL